MFATFYLAALSTGSWVYVFSALLDDRSLVFVAVILWTLLQVRSLSLLFPRYLPPRLLYTSHSHTHNHSLLPV